MVGMSMWNSVFIPDSDDTLFFLFYFTCLQIDPDHSRAKDPMCDINDTLNFQVAS